MFRFSPTLLIVIFLISPICLGKETTICYFEELKKEIGELQKKLQGCSSSEASALHYKLACALMADQEIDLAFRHFLFSLQTVEKKDAYKPQEEERKCYEDALAEYLTCGSTDPVAAAKKLLERYGNLADERRDFVLLNFLISTAYANLGKYESFFERFYKAYPFLYDSFLAYKTQGILFLRLSSRCIDDEERMRLKEQAFQHLTKAQERNVFDYSLYKILIFLAKEERNDALLSTYLHRLLAQQVVIPRSDVYLFVREAVSIDELDTAQKIIDHARSLYENSRVISTAEDYLNQHKGTIGSCK